MVLKGLTQHDGPSSVPSSEPRRPAKSTRRSITSRPQLREAAPTRERRPRIFKVVMGPVVARQVCVHDLPGPGAPPARGKPCSLPAAMAARCTAAAVTPPLPCPSVTMSSTGRGDETRGKNLSAGLGPRAGLPSIVGRPVCLPLQLLHPQVQHPRNVVLVCAFRPSAVVPCRAEAELVHLDHLAVGDQSHPGVLRQQQRVLQRHGGGPQVRPPPIRCPPRTRRSAPRCPLWV